jgi:hypothetical protein
MLKVLRGRNVYEETFQTPIGFKPVDAIPPSKQRLLLPLT